MAIEIETTGDDVSESRQERVRARARTVSIKRLSKRELERGRELYPETDYDAPVRRADCMQGEHAERPCPFVSCKYHLYLDVSPKTGAIKLNFPGLEVWELRESCALDLSERGGLNLEEIGAVMNLTRERIRQLETKGLAKLKELNEMAALQDYLDAPAVTREAKPEDTRAGTESKIAPTPRPLGRVQPYGLRRYRAPTLQPMDRDRAAAARRVHETLRAHAEGDDYAAPRIDPASELQSSLAFSVRDGGE